MYTLGSSRAWARGYSDRVFSCISVSVCSWTSLSFSSRSTQQTPVCTPTHGKTHTHTHPRTRTPHCNTHTTLSLDSCVCRKSTWTKVLIQRVAVQASAGRTVESSLREAPGRTTSVEDGVVPRVDLCTARVGSTALRTSDQEPAPVALLMGVGKVKRS